MREKKVFCIYGCFSISRQSISKKLKNCIFRNNFIFRHICMYKQPILTKQWNFKTFMQYYVVISDTLIDSWMCFYYCSLYYYQRFMRNQEGKFELQKKSTQKNLCVGITFLAASLPSCVIFCRFFVYSLPFVYSDFKQEKNLLQQKMVVGGADEVRSFHFMTFNFQVLYLIRSGHASIVSLSQGHTDKSISKIVVLRL